MSNDSFSASCQISELSYPQDMALPTAQLYVHRLGQMASSMGFTPTKLAFPPTARLCLDGLGFPPTKGVNYPPPALTLRGGGFVPLTRTQGRHMPAVPFDRDYVSSMPDLRGGRP